MAIFTWSPDWSPSIAKNPAISVVKFGDGYVQRLAKGINNNLRRLSLTFSVRSDAEANEIMTFLDAYGGCTAFQFRLKDTDEYRYWITDGEYKRVLTGPDHNSITATFQEVPSVS